MWIEKVVLRPKFTKAKEIMIGEYGMPGNKIGMEVEGDKMLLFFTRPRFEFVETTGDFTIHFLSEMVLIEVNGSKYHVPYHQPVEMEGRFKEIFQAYVTSLVIILEEPTS